jgi:tRNA(Leu) C34 or U34 (ribose-2'-O)-methylase TrmL
MVYRDLISAGNRNNSLHERRRNIRTTLTKQQFEVSNNAQNNILSYTQEVTGVPAYTTSNNNQNNIDIATQLTSLL